MSSTILASNLHVSWDTIGCSLCSSEDQLGVPAVCRGSCALLPPTLLPYSNLPLQVFTARVFEALFSLIETLGCTVCLTSQLFLPAYPYSNVGNPIHQPPCPPKVASHCLANSSCPPWLPISPSLTSLGECFFLTSLVIELRHSLIFWQFWLLLLLLFFSLVFIILLVVSIYASILTGTLKGF